MKVLFGIFTVTLLLTAAAVTLARRENSGWIVFAGSAGDVYLMTGNGGASHRISADGVCGFDPRWSPDGEWIAFVDYCAFPRVFLLIRPGGAIVRQVSLPPSSTADILEWSPDGSRLLLVGHPELAVAQTDGSGYRLLANNDHDPQWSPDGAWIYALNGSGTAMTLRRIQTETTRSEDLLTVREPFTNLTWSPDGSQIMFGMPGEGDYDLFRMSPDGSDLQTIPLDPSILNIREQHYSPDGEWIAFVGGSASGWDIYRVRPDGRDLERLTERGRDVYDKYSSIQWSADGQELIFEATGTDHVDIYRLGIDTSELENLTPNLGRVSSPHYIPASGRAWHPLLLFVGAVVIFAASVFIKMLNIRQVISYRVGGTPAEHFPAARRQLGDGKPHSEPGRH